MAPTLTALEPNTAAISDPDFTIRCLGTGFDEGSVIVWMGADEPTTFVSDTEVTTLVKPSVVSSPTTIPVLVRTGLGEESSTLDFTWTEAAAAGGDDPYAGNPQIPAAIPSDPNQAWDCFLVAATHAIVPHARDGVDFVVARPNKGEAQTNVHWDDALLGARPGAEIETEARRLASEWPAGVLTTPV